VHCYIELARCLGRDQPFYALQHPGVDGDVDALRDFDQMAAAYLEAVRAVQAHGPYFLGGWSFGGTVAFEMARQLRAAGEAVAFLALMDTPAPAGLYPELRPAFETAGILTFLGRGLGEIFGNDMRLDPREFEGLSEAQQFDHFLGRAGQVDGMDVLAGGRDQFERILAMFHAADRAERQYRPEPYDGPLTMYRVQAMDDYEFTGYKLHPDLRDPAFGWNALSSRGVEVRRVPGTHMTMVVRPHVDVLARELAAGLQAAQAACSELAAGGVR
jgi:thioesterase domain-containing protein